MRTLPFFLTLSDVFCIVKSYDKIKIIYWLTGLFVKQFQVFQTGYQTLYHAFDNYIKKLLNTKLSIIDLTWYCFAELVQFSCLYNLFNASGNVNTILDINYNMYENFAKWVYWNLSWVSCLMIPFIVRLFIFWNPNDMTICILIRKSSFEKT